MTARARVLSSLLVDPNGRQDLLETANDILVALAAGEITPTEAVALAKQYDATATVIRLAEEAEESAA